MKKKLLITLLIEDTLDTGVLTKDEIEDSARRFFIQAQEENPWGGLNGAPIYIEEIREIEVCDDGWTTIKPLTEIKLIFCECDKHKHGKYMNNDPSYTCLDCGLMVPTL